VVGRSSYQSAPLGPPSTMVRGASGRMAATSPRHSAERGLVDRCAAYAARYLAKNVVAAGLADRCTIQIAYAIGVAKPLSIYVDCYGTGQVAEARLEKALSEVMDLTPRGIREHLGLNRPIYARTSAYGHFGGPPEADGGFSWERTDLVDELRSLAN
jgi:S-adenosylmethionine synthetase